MSGARSRRKGASGERRAVKLMEAITGEDWRRAAGGEDQPLGDVICASGLGHPWDTVLVEVKAHRACRAEHLLMPTRRELEWWAKASRQARDAPLHGGLSRWAMLVVWLHGRGGVLVSEEYAAPYVGHELTVGWRARAKWGGDAVRLVGVKG
jgi:hypothetical protein